MRYLIALILFSLLINSFDCSFQATIFNTMNKKRRGENLIISPLSIFQALSLAANGAKKKTQSEMLDLLQSDSIDELNEKNYQVLRTFKEFTTIDIANAVMTRFTPLEEFSNVSQKYLAPIEPLKSAEQVNSWCSNKTHGKIDKIIDQLDPNILMIILNAVYFKGEWISKFKEFATKPLPFYNFGKEEIEIETMSQIAHFNYYEDKKVQAIELGFKKDFMSAIIILPSEGIDINQYIDTLSISNDEYKNIIKGLKNAKVHLQLPKFELKMKEQLNEFLSDLGMYDAFDPINADFTGLRHEGELFIDYVLHKTYLKVFEDGCEAAAVTAIGLAGSGMPIEEIIYDMKINRPFLFLLKNSMLPDGYNLVFMSKIEKFD
jgi:serpin B